MVHPAHMVELVSFKTFITINHSSTSHSHERLCVNVVLSLVVRMVLVGSPHVLPHLADQCLDVHRWRRGRSGLLWSWWSRHMCRTFCPPDSLLLLGVCPHLHGAACRSQASLVDEYFIMLLRNEPFFVGGGARVALLELLLPVLLLLLLLACRGVGSPFVFSFSWWMGGRLRQMSWRQRNKDCSNKS